MTFQVHAQINPWLFFFHINIVGQCNYNAGVIALTDLRNGKRFLFLTKTKQSVRVRGGEAAIGSGGWNGQGLVACIAWRMINRWWWTYIECGKKQGAFLGMTGISYSCIVITFTVIHLRPTPRGRAHDTPAMESEMLSYQAGWLSKSHKIPLPLVSFVSFSFHL